MIYDLVLWKEKLSKPAGLQAQLLMAPELRKEELEKYNNAKPQLKSAVLILIYIDEKDNKPYIVLTLRSTKLRKHSGQVSFPGGKMDESDKSLEETALREAEEEIGLKRNSDIEILGNLSPLLIPVTNFKVYPIVSFAKSKPNFRINVDEVEKILFVSLEDLLTVKNIKQKSFGKSSSGIKHQAPYFDLQNVEIWGATAMMLAELITTLFPNSEFAKHPYSFY